MRVRYGSDHGLCDGDRADDDTNDADEDGDGFDGGHGEDSHDQDGGDPRGSFCDPCAQDSDCRFCACLLARCTTLYE